MRIDSHKFKERLEKEIKHIENPSKDSDWSNLSGKNREKLLEYYNHLAGRGVSEGRVLKYLYTLKTIGKILGKNFEDADKKDIERVLATLRSAKSPISKKAYTSNTMKDFKVVLKVFYKWLRNYPGKKAYPPEVDWFTCTIGKNEMEIKEIMKHEDVIKLIESIPDVKFRAFFGLLYETAMRPEECLSIVWNDVQDIPKGKMIVVHGKTGARVLYSFWSAKHLIAWMNIHPNMLRKSADPNMPLWVSRNVGDEILPLHYSTVNQYFHKIVKQNELKFKKEPSMYILRRTRLTELLRIFPEGLVKLIAGHSKSSNTLGKYYNALTSNDVYDALASYYGISVKKAIQKDRVDLNMCPVCNAQVTPDQNYCVSCMTPLKQEYAQKMKDLQKEYDDFISNPKNKELIFQFIEFMHKQKKE